MKKNIFIIILAFLVVGLGGFIAYDNFFKPNTKCEVKETKISKTTKTSDERYKEYLTNLSKNIEKKYKNSNDLDDISNTSTYKNEDINESYTIKINQSKDLLLTVNRGMVDSKYTNYKLDGDVVSFYRVHTGNGGYYSIYYITEEGKVYSISLDKYLYENTDIVSNEVKDVKNIIEVKEGTGAAGFPIFVDIDGNMFTPNVTE